MTNPDVKYNGWNKNLILGRGLYLVNIFPSKRILLKRSLIFSKELLTHTSGDLDEALDWLKMLDKEYSIFTDEYTIDDFVEDLTKKGYIKEEFALDEDGNTGEGSTKITHSQVGNSPSRICTWSNFRQTKRMASEIIARPNWALAMSEMVSTKPTNTEMTGH